MKRPHIAAHTILWLLTLTPAAVVAAGPGLAARSRDLLGFTLTSRPGSLAEAAGIAGTNARVLTAIVLAAYAASRAGALRPALDGLVGLVVMANAALVGTALGAYGLDGLPWLVHLPLEWAALAKALAVYLTARRRPLHSVRIARVLVVLVAFTAVAALLETYATP